MRSREENLARLRREQRPIEPGQKFEVGDFEPRDAEGVAALFYAVYGEGFAVDSVYDPDQIIAANASGQAHHVVGRTLAGEVVGVQAYFRNPPGRHIMELGSWIVLPAYRNTSLAMRLARRILEEPPARLDLQVIYSQNVCDHLISQKAGERFGFHSWALSLEAMPPRPEAAPGEGGGRISLIEVFRVLRDTPQAIHLPEAYAAALPALYESRGLRREFLADAPPRGESRSSVLDMEAASFSRMTFEAVGADAPAHLERFARDHQGLQVLHLAVPLWIPGVSLAVKAAREAGFFLAGLLPLWDDRDMLLMQRLRAEPDWSAPKLYTQEARDLLALIAADRESVRRGA